MQHKGLHRNTIDKFYTKAIVAEYCLTIITKYLVIHNTDIIIEPSAGDGAFISGIKLLTSNWRFFDIEPEHKDIIKQDFLTYEHNPTGTTHVVGNPPFGRQSSIAIRFIKKASEFCSSISFILPRSFKKASLQRAFPLCFHLIHEEDLPDNSFLVNGIEHSVPCVLQIWRREPSNRSQKEKLLPQGFVFTSKDSSPDISVRRVGVYAGKIDTECDNKSIQSHYFVRFTNGIPVTETVEKLARISYVCDNTVGPKSISKQELIEQFNAVLRY